MEYVNGKTLEDIMTEQGHPLSVADAIGAILGIHNVTYPGERMVAEHILLGFELYSNDSAQLRYEYGQAAGKTAQDPHMILAYQYYLDAERVLHTQITTQPLLNVTGQPAESGVPACTIGDPICRAPVL